MAAALTILLLFLAPAALAQAPLEDDRFVNLAGHGERGGTFSVRLPFFMRAIGRSMRTSNGAAKLVPYDPQALQENPGITWIGHSSFLVRFDGASFLTDPIFSERASPVSFAGPARVVPPGVPLDQLPPIDFVTISHDHYDHADLPSITGDRDRLIQVVINLISNAVKFTPEGSITIVAWHEVEGGWIQVAVSDTGVGIAEADLDKVFEPFAQASSAGAVRARGTGLGLPICREIIEHHGGRLWLQSHLGAGSTFQFTLPI